MTELLLFDLGGVLVRLTGVSTMLEWTPGNLTEPELWERWLHSESIRAFESGEIEADQFAEDVVAEFDLSIPKSVFLEAFVTWADGLFEHVETLLTSLRPRFRLAPMSNTNSIHWPRLKNEMGIGKLIDTHFPSHLTGLLKPDRAAFENVAQQLEVEANRILFFDDNQINVDGAREAGLQAEIAKGPTQITGHLYRMNLIPNLSTQSSILDSQCLSASHSQRAPQRISSRSGTIDATS